MYNETKIKVENELVVSVIECGDNRAHFCFLIFYHHHHQITGCLE